MQLERSYFRHLKFENLFNEFIFNSRPANKKISFAVKTCRPQNFKVQKICKDMIIRIIV